MFGMEINESYLDKIYDDFRREQGILMEAIKQGAEEDKAKDMTTQITILNSLTMMILRFRNLKKKLALKINC
jgi:hypothetical protein